jgi:diacylglycerol kinase
MTDRNGNGKNQPFHKRLRYAIAGIRETWRRERSFRTQSAAAGLVVLALLAIRPPAVWWALAGFVVFIVFAMELVNAALETLIDHLHPDIHPQIRIVKDMAAGAVLLVAIGAVVVAAILLVAAAMGWA